MQKLILKEHKLHRFCSDFTIHEFSSSKFSLSGCNPYKGYKSKRQKWKHKNLFICQILNPPKISYILCIRYNCTDPIMTYLTTLSIVWSVNNIPTFPVSFYIINEHIQNIQCNCKHFTIYTISKSNRNLWAIFHPDISKNICWVFLVSV